MDTLLIKKGHDRRLRNGHLWVFSNELSEVPMLEPGTVVEVKNNFGDSYGLGFYNPNSLIAVRLLKTIESVNLDFFKSRIIQALNYRQRLNLDLNMMRLVYGESDFLPGLIIDKYNDYFAIQSFSVGIENRINEILEALLSIFPKTKGIIEKNNSNARTLEGLIQRQSVLYGTIPDEIISEENNIKLSISLESGQKTGYFLDQKINRLFLQNISKDLDVLDCFCNQGGFALNAMKGSARNATCVDVSSSSLKNAEKNFQLNDFAKVDFIESNVFEFLNKELDRGNYRDMIILDPPSFAKNKKSIGTAKAGYAKINKMALIILKSNGYLVTSSCSMHIDEPTFYSLIINEAQKLGKQLRLIYSGMQSPDHPVLANMPETRYLKFFVFEVI